MALSAKDKNWLKIGGGVVAAVILYNLVMPKTDSSGKTCDPTNNSGGPCAAFNASQKAEELYNIMKESGTDEMKIVKALKNVNEAQFAQVKDKFMFRSYNKLLGNQINFNPFSKLPLVDLPGWLENELSTTQYNVLQKKYPNYL